MQANLLNSTFAQNAANRDSTPVQGVSKKKLWTGRVFTALAGLFLLVDGFVKVIEIAPVVKGSAELGYPLSTMAPIGITLMISTLLYLIPRTAFFGALLLTGYLGGAIATHVRVEHPLFSHTLFPVYVAVLVWAGLTLRDPRIEALVRGIKPK